MKGAARQNAHVLTREFGLDKEGQVKLLDQLLRSQPIMDNITAQMVAMSAYETAFGIYNHTDEKAPAMALVYMHAKEEFLEGGRREAISAEYRRARIMHHYGINLLEFLQLEKWYAEFLIDDCMKAEKEEAKRTKNALDGVGAQLPGMKR